MGQHAHALTAARRCVELEPAFAKGHYRLGQALLAAGDARGAAGAFEAGMAHTTTDAERADFSRELRAANTKAKAAPPPAASSAAADVAEAEVSPSSRPAAARSVRRVDHDRAVEISKRVAERAASAPSPGSGAKSADGRLTASEFERSLLRVWAGGKGADRTEELAACLGALPDTSAAIVGFFGAAMTEELLSGLVRAADVALAPAAAAALLSHLTEVQRFSMVQMFLGAKEKEAATRVFERAISDGADAPALRKAAASYDVKL